MFTLAEIADKMPTIAGMWPPFAIISIVLAAIAISHRWAALATVLLAGLLSAFFVWGAYHEAYLEGSFSDAIWRELGAGWVVNSFASSLLPFVAVVLIVLLKWRPQLTVDARE